VEADRATLTDACYTMSKLRKFIEYTSMISVEVRRQCLTLMDAKLVKRPRSSEMALCVTIDPRQDIGRGESKLMTQAERGLQERSKRLYDLKVISYVERISDFKT